MTGAMVAMMSAGNPVVPSWSGSIVHTNPGGSVSGNVSINTDGTISGTRYSGTSAWYLPSGGTPGNSYYVKFTATGDAWDTGLVSGTVYALTSNRSVAWSESGADVAATLTVSIYSDAGGTILLGTGTVAVVLTGSP